MHRTEFECLVILLSVIRNGKRIEILIINVRWVTCMCWCLCVCIHFSVVFVEGEFSLKDYIFALVVFHFIDGWNIPFIFFLCCCCLPKHRRNCLYRTQLCVSLHFGLSFCYSMALYIFSVVHACVCVCVCVWHHYKPQCQLNAEKIAHKVQKRSRNASNVNQFMRICFATSWYPWSI